MLHSFGRRALAALGLNADVGGRLDDNWQKRFTQLAIVSDFAIDTLRRQPELWQRWIAGDESPEALPVLVDEIPTEWFAQLRHYRAAESVRLIWRDIHGQDDIEATLAGSTRLAETCLNLALEALEREFAARYGVVRAPDGTPQRLVVFALGKLGGEELNFSSDIDLVYAYPQSGQSDGVRSLAAEDYFARLGQRLSRLLDDITVDGFCYRVDLRLRPFGNVGQIAWSFPAMDQYFQREGRDWERYAWLKARPVAGDIKAGEHWLQTLRPFIYRRYLDFTALDGLRSMKATIAAEVAQHNRGQDIKCGPGGIREIEFLVQSLQLIRGGREPALRERGLLSALQALGRAGQINPETAIALGEDYRFLRHVENRLQMLRDMQTQNLPEDALDRERIASGLGYPDWQEFMQILENHRRHVADEFDALLAVRRASAPSALMQYWLALPEGGDSSALDAAGFMDAVEVDHRLRDFSRSTRVRALSDAARVRLDRVMPVFLIQAAHSARPDVVLERCLSLLRAILRRASYLALLDEQPSALERLINILSRSAMLGEQLVAYPVLLDELLDSRVAGTIPDAEQMRNECRAIFVDDDPEVRLHKLNEIQRALSFRVGLATLDGRQSAGKSARQLADLADAIVMTVVALAENDLRAAHGSIPGGRFAVVGYGSLGGQELGFGSDLDLVFLYDADESAMSTGSRALEAPRWYARLTQKIMALLGTVTGAGRLYDIDVRLRPDGGKGLLVSSLHRYEEYQRERAWTWEHQALVRARHVAGEATLLSDFDAIRCRILAQRRSLPALRTDIAQMRYRMRNELDRGHLSCFDLKQGVGGLVDLEFWLQYHVLAYAAEYPELLLPRSTPDFLQVLPEIRLIEEKTAQELRIAHEALVEAGLACTLDRLPRLVQESEAVRWARTTIEATTRDVLLTDMES